MILASIALSLMRIEVTIPGGDVNNVRMLSTRLSLNCKNVQMYLECVKLSIQNGQLFVLCPVVYKDLPLFF